MFERLGALVARWLAEAGAFSIFCARAFRDAFRRPFEIDEIGRQIYEVGWRSVPLIATSGFAVGIVFSLHTRASLAMFGAESMIPAGLGVSLIREVGPLVAGLMFSGRVGAGIGAELGAMKVTEQIDALEALAVDSFKYLAVTRIIACVIAMPILTALIDFTGIAGGFVAESAVSGMSYRLYFERAFLLVNFDHFITSVLKTSVFGFLIASVASYLGIHASSGTEGVGRASTMSVVAGSILIIVVNVVLVKLIFFLFPEGGA